MRLITERNPIYHESTKITKHERILFNKLLIGLDTIINGECISVKVGEKYVVKCMWGDWREEEGGYKRQPSVNLYSVQGLTVINNRVYMKFSYYNQFEFTIAEKEILALIRVEDYSKRKHAVIKKMIEELKAEIQYDRKTNPCKDR